VDVVLTISTKMGVSSSLLEDYRSLLEVANLLQRFKDHDFDFALGVDQLRVLVRDKETGKAIAKSFAPDTGVVNVLSFIAGAAALSKGKNLSKAAVIFETFDLHNQAFLAEHAVVMLLMSVVQGCVVLANLDKEKIFITESETLLSRCRKAVSQIFVTFNIEVPTKGPRKILKNQFEEWVTLRLGNTVSKDEILP
jgi:hypothetical protein